jgi:hypothetical protein
MEVHGHTPDCRHSTDKPARLDSNDAFLYIAAAQLGTWFRMRLAHSANLPQPAPMHRISEHVRGHTSATAS